MIWVKKGGCVGEGKKGGREGRTNQKSPRFSGVDSPILETLLGRNLDGCPKATQNRGNNRATEKGKMCYKHKQCQLWDFAKVLYKFCLTPQPANQTNASDIVVVCRVAIVWVQSKLGLNAGGLQVIFAAACYL